MSSHQPEVDVATRTYWSAAAEGRLIGSRCDDCNALADYPRGFCPVCWSEKVRDVALSGRATLYTYSVVHVNPVPPFGDMVPYITAIVDLEEGPRLTTRLVDVEPSEVRIGMALEARFETIIPDEGLPLFGPPAR